MKKAIILNCIIPIIYIGLYISLRLDHLSLKTQDFIYGNGIFFWIGQSVTVIIGFILSKNSTVRILLSLIWLLFFFFEFNTIKLFNAFSA
jgi:hypothetical protein